MTAEPLGETTYKITLDKSETEGLPHDGKPCEMNRFIRSILDRLSTEQGIDLPEGRLLVEAFVKSDGSFVFFVSPLDGGETEKKQHLCACDISGIEQLRAVCAALLPFHVQCDIYCGSSPENYRLLFTSPDENTARICLEYGEYNEISPLFAAQTEEYLTVIAAGNGADILSEIL